MEKGTYYSITTKRFVLRSRHRDWLIEMQELYNQVLRFYYDLFLEKENIQNLNNMQACRALEVLTVVGRDKQPVPYPLPWEKLPLYFRRAAINAAISAGRSYLTRQKQQIPTERFAQSVTFYKGMYRDFTQEEISLKVWNGMQWQWIHCRLSGNHLPKEAECLSPCVVIREKEIFLNVPVRQLVRDGRKAKERMGEESSLCCVQFTNEDAAAVCVVLNGHGEQQSVHFLKGGKQYEHSCRLLMDRIERSNAAIGDQKDNQPNKKYWMKLKHISDSFSNGISRQIVNIALEQGADIIVLPKYKEDYTRMVMKKVGNWSPLHASFKIREQLSYKAWKEGLLLLEVDTWDAAGCCSKCGAPIKKEGTEYSCSNGHRGNRFMNTAVNMGRKCIASFRKHASDQNQGGNAEL